MMRLVARRVRLLSFRLGALAGRPPPRSDGFDFAYSGDPPWEIGKPQPELVRLVKAGAVKGVVLDVGCGSGEIVRYLSERGVDATGIDISPTAVEIATRKAQERALKAKFVVGDALRMNSIDMTFDTILSSGLLHEFSDQERRQFAASVWSVLRAGGTFFLLAVSSANGSGPWPAGHSEHEILSTFQDGWMVNHIEPAQIESRFGPVKAWLASFSKPASVELRSR